VDVLVGTHNLRLVPELLEADGGGRPAVDLDRRSDPFSVSEIVADRASPVRAYVTVMEGCNHVCSFCVVPRTRGPEVNRPPEDVVEEVAALVGRGYPEVMLLGQTVNAYRRGDVDFAELLARVHSVPGLRRLRFTTSHPVHVSTRLAEAFRDLPRLCPYLHLPVQSGSDRLLACMRRGYTAGQYRETVAMLREHVPGIALSTDVIVGYPGETTADFEATLALLEAVTFDSLFAFAYSPRPGTTALRLADDVPSQEKRRRLRLVNDLQQRRQRTLRASQVGKQQNVLIDTLDGPGRVSGRSPDFRIVHLDGPQEWLGRVVPVEITEAGANAFRGRAVLAGSLPAQPVH
jgi:tRNA-2-methylthio-N6-dimethylallyladenosine synthase